MILGRCNFLSRVWYMSELSKEHTAAITNLQQCAFLSIPAQRTNRIGHKSSTFPNFSANRASTSGAKSKSNKTNRLALEKSPYLLQHATNPVDWYPWCDEALEKAKKEDELIFLSVGYSTCHWCHVMEKESFKNKEIAKVMNENFVNIKVDREERPDIDRIYMTFVQEWIGHCAWPMSVFLTPDLKPIGGGTYFPPWDSFGQTGFKTILLKISQNWKQVKSKLVEWGCINLETLQNISEIPLTSKTDEMLSLETGIICVQQLTSEFDPTFGGFDSSYIMQAPKFPQPVNFNLLIHMYARQPTGELAKHCLHMCTYTLTKMSYSGIHDHVGQGFSRSATCGEWHVRHFEKMLYDQGQLMQSYADAYVATKETLYAEIIDDIATYVIRDLRHKEGGFYSAEDGDSYPTHNATVKKEGAYYVWTHAEITSLLNKEISGKDMKYSDVFCFHFNVKESGNVKKYQDPHGELTGKNMLMVYDGIKRTAKQFNLSVQETKKYLKETCSILYEARCVRPRPHLDDKILTAWNGLMMSGLARGGSAVGNKEYIKYARDIAKFVERYLFDEKRNVLLRSCYRGYRDVITQARVPISGFLDDYAFIVKGLLDLYEATLEERWLEFAEKIHDIQDSLFWDDSNGGYFSTMSDDPCIILRLKEVHDGAEPSGNSVAAENLLRLADYLGRGELKDRAKLLFGAFRQLLTQRPVALPQMVSALVRYHDGATQIYVAGKRGAKDTEDLLQAVYQHLIPNRILFLVDQDETNGLLFRKNENLKNMRPVDGKAAAYVCRHHTCSLPVTSAEQFASLLEEERQENS